MGDPRPLFQSLAPAVALALAPTPARADDLPPPPGAVDLGADVLLHLDLIVNEAPTGRIVSIHAQESHLRIATAVLREVGIQIDPAAPAVIDLAAYPDVVAEYDQPGQRLLLRVPAAWLPGQRIASTGVPRVPAHSSIGALLNYDLYVANQNGSGGTSGSLWTEARVFSDLGVLRNDGIYRWQSRASRRGTGYVRYDTSWTYIDDVHIRTYEAGDFITRTLPWGSPVRLGGFQLSRNFSVRPDVVTYPVPSFSSVAAVPTAVDLFIDGYQSWSGTVEPGPFTLNNLPYVNGAGQAVVATTDAQGRRVSTTLPFYVANSLLRPGLADYALSIGKLRHDYGVRSFSYGPAAANAALRYGLSDTLTVEATGEATRGLGLVGGGAQLRIGTLGVVNGSVSLSRHGGATGHRIVAGYQYNGRRFNLAIQHLRHSDTFRDLASFDLRSYTPVRRQTQATLGVVLGRQGTLSASYVEAVDRRQRFRLASIGYYRPLFGSSSLSLSLSRDFDRRQFSAAAQVVFPLGRYGTAAAGVERSDGEFRERLGYDRAVPSEGGLGGSLSVNRREAGPADYQAALTWRAPYVQVQGGLYGSGGSQVRWADLSGSVVAIGGTVRPTNRVNDAFVLVSTDGVPNVPVRFEHRLLGTTDRSGHLLIPGVTAYYGAHYEIDPLDLPADVIAPVVEQRAAVRLGSGSVVRFPLRRVRAASITLVDSAGRPLPLGTTVEIGTGGTDGIGYVGQDGVTYLEGVSETTHVSAILADGSPCRASFVSAPDSSMEAIGPVTCR